MKSGIFLFAAVLFCGLLLLPVLASGDMITFDLGAGNAAISGFPGPYANVEIDLTTPTTAVVTLTSLTNSGFIYLIGDGGSVALNVNADTWLLGPVTGTNAGSGFTPGPFTDDGANVEDGFGSFNQTIDDFDGFTHSADFIQFMLTDTSGSWAGAASVLAPNADGFSAAAHIFVTSDPAVASNGALATGFATGNGHSVPEPGTFLLLGIGVFGLLAYGRLRIRA